MTFRQLERVEMELNNGKQEISAQQARDMIALIKEQHRRMNAAAWALRGD